MPLAKVELDRLLAKWNLPPAGRELVIKVFTTPPARDVKSGTTNVRTRYVSEKTGLVVIAESRTVELSALRDEEHNAATLWYKHQPATLDLFLPTGRPGRPSRVQHTPDIGVVSRKGFVFKEWRTEARLQRLCAEKPLLWRRDADGIYHYLPAEEYCEKLGLSHEVHSDREHNIAYLTNMEILRDHIGENAQPVPAEAREHVLEILKKSLRVPYLDLVGRHGVDANHLLPLIFEGVAWVDLKRNRLDEPKRVIVYKSPEVEHADAIVTKSDKLVRQANELVIEVGQQFVYDNVRLTISRIDKDAVVVTDPLGMTSTWTTGHLRELFLTEDTEGGAAVAQKLMTEASPIFDQPAWEKAANKLAQALGEITPTVSLRTLQYWKAKIAHTDVVEEQIEALMDRRCGNAAAKVADDAIALADEIIETVYNVKNGPPAFRAWEAYVHACFERGVMGMGMSSFYVRLKKRKDVLKRDGRKVHYQQTHIENLPEHYHYSTPVDGVAPYHTLYIDFTPLDLKTKGRKIKVFDRPVTLCVGHDPALPAPMAFHISYRDESGAAVLLLLRDFVRRHQVLPRLLVVDNGPGFKSKELEEFCRLYRIDIRWRRKSKPRDSAKIERLFGCIETEFIASLKGNTIRSKNRRSTSPENNPADMAEWELQELYWALEEYLFTYRWGIVHAKTGMTPREREAELIKRYGDPRARRTVRYDARFKILTSPTAGHPTRKIDRVRGLFVNGAYYTNSILKSLKQRNVQVRVEMLNEEVIYFEAEGKWYPAFSREGFLRGRTRYEVERAQAPLILAERTRLKALSKASRVTIDHIAIKQKLRNPNNFRPEYREMEALTGELLRQIDMGEAIPEARNPLLVELDIGPQTHYSTMQRPQASSSNATSGIPTHSGNKASGGAGFQEGADPAKTTSHASADQPSQKATVPPEESVKETTSRQAPDQGAARKDDTKEPSSPMPEEEDLWI